MHKSAEAFLGTPGARANMSAPRPRDTRPGGCITDLSEIECIGSSEKRGRLWRERSLARRIKEDRRKHGAGGVGAGLFLVPREINVLGVLYEYRGESCTVDDLECYFSLSLAAEAPLEGEYS